jgi:hypothetical protein
MPAKAHRDYEIIVWALWGKSGDKFKLLMRANSALCLAKISLPGCKVSFPECKALCLVEAGNYETNTTLKTLIFSSFNIVQARTERLVFSS